MDRRTFLGASTAAALATATASKSLAANDKIVVCVMGVRGRGGNLLSTFAKNSEVEVKYVCDIDESVLNSRSQQVKDSTGRMPIKISDYQRALADPDVDAVVNGCPDHWHALPTIHACQAKKDVYVEKPDGHNVIEGQTMVAAARKYGRVVQLGTQARSGTLQASAMNYIREGHLGRALFAKAWESSKQGNIGYPKDSAPPAGVDYDRWLGAAPKRAFNARRFHGSWRWFFDYGTGDLGNDGVHRLDVARWALQTAVETQKEKLPTAPRTISAHGGKYYFDDAQEWPDTLMATYDYDGFVLTYEMRVWTRYPLHGESEGALVYGDGGSIVIGNRRWRAFDERGKQIKEVTGGYNDSGHAQNFLDCMRSRKRPNADLETVGHPSSLLCHLGNLAWRAGRSVQFDFENYRLLGDNESSRFLTRPVYRKPYSLPKIADL